MESGLFRQSDALEHSGCLAECCLLIVACPNSQTDLFTINNAHPKAKSFAHGCNARARWRATQSVIYSSLSCPHRSWWSAHSTGQPVGPSVYTGQCSSCVYSPTIQTMSFPGKAKINGDAFERPQTMLIHHSLVSRWLTTTFLGTYKSNVSACDEASTHSICDLQCVLFRAKS